MGALSYVFVVGYANTSRKDVMKVASFLFIYTLLLFNNWDPTSIKITKILTAFCQKQKTRIYGGFLWMDN
jgi:hypothetical protein